MSPPGIVTLLGFEVGGLGLPLWYRTYPVGNVHATLRYARNPYITVYCQTPRRHAVIMTPEPSETLAIEEVGRFFRRRVYRLTGTKVDETVWYLSAVNRTEEVEKLLVPYIDYVAQNFYVA